MSRIHMRFNEKLMRKKIWSNSNRINFSIKIFQKPNLIWGYFHLRITIAQNIRNSPLQRVCWIHCVDVYTHNDWKVYTRTHMKKQSVWFDISTKVRLMYRILSIRRYTLWNHSLFFFIQYFFSFKLLINCKSSVNFSSQWP